MYDAIILGIVQGLTEFFPVSSTAHLIILPWFFQWGGDVNNLTFDVALHAGTLFSLFAYFRKDWTDILLRRRRLLWMIIAASVPAGAAGLLLDNYVEHRLRSPYIITASLVLIGIVMLMSEKVFKHRSFEQLGLTDSLWIGLSQALALIPGVSRSGITISAGLFLGFEREAAARFSFLLSTPVIAGATLLHSIKIFSGNAEYNLQLFATGFAASAVTGFVAIAFLINFFRKYPLNLFVYYRFVLAAVIITGIWLKS